MSGINRVILVGRLGQDPESKQLDNGNTVTNFSVATSETWTDKTTGEKKETTEWHRISVFGKLAEVAAQYLKKGRQCYVEGKLKTRSYEVDGVKKYSTDILADKIEFLGDSKTSEAETTTTVLAPKMAATPPTTSTKRPYNHAPGAVNDADMGF
jgi:single-strand DNA-binding protein